MCIKHNNRASLVLGITCEICSYDRKFCEDHVCGYDCDEEK